MDKKPHLFLHFDVNKTILMSDPLRNQDVAEVLNETLAESAWGIEVDGVNITIKMHNKIEMGSSIGQDIS